MRMTKTGRGRQAKRTATTMRMTATTSAVLMATRGLAEGEERLSRVTSPRTSRAAVPRSRGAAVRSLPRLAVGPLRPVAALAPLAAAPARPAAAPARPAARPPAALEATAWSRGRTVEAGSHRAPGGARAPDWADVR